MTKIALNNIGKGEESQGAVASNERVKIKQKFFILKLIISPLHKPNQLIYVSPLPFSQ